MPQPCKHTGEGCKFIGKKTVMREHEDNQCKFRRIKCKYSGDGCSFVGREDTIREHEDACNFGKIKCKNSHDGCIFTGKKDIMKGHEKECEFRTVKCMHTTCKDSIPLRLILDHMKLKHSVIFEGRGSNGSHNIFLRYPPLSTLVTQYGISHFEEFKFLSKFVMGKREDCKIHVFVLGNDNIAQRFGVRMNIGNVNSEWKEKATMGMTFMGKIFSILENNAGSDHAGVLKFSPYQAEMMQERGDGGSLGLRVQFAIFERDESGAAGARLRPSAPSWNSVNQPWKCAKCTYMNTTIEHQDICEMCSNDRTHDDSSSEELNIEATVREHTASTSPVGLTKHAILGPYFNDAYTERGRGLRKMGSKMGSKIP